MLLKSLGEFIVECAHGHTWHPYYAIILSNLLEERTIYT